MSKCDYCIQEYTSGITGKDPEKRRRSAERRANPKGPRQWFHRPDGERCGFREPCTDHADKFTNHDAQHACLACQEYQQKLEREAGAEKLRNGATMFGKTRIVLKQGDITEEQVDAIVNAANTTLLGGGGVDGAIHRKGGPAILEECKAIRAKQGGCATGEAVITIGGKLPARYVIHTVGPVWNATKKAAAGERKEDVLLRSAYENSLRLAVENGVKTIAFPSISTGAYRFPIQRAALIALKAARNFCLTNDSLEEIRFVSFSAGDLSVYDEALGDV